MFLQRTFISSPIFNQDFRKLGCMLLGIYKRGFINSIFINDFFLLLNDLLYRQSETTGKVACRTDI